MNKQKTYLIGIVVLLSYVIFPQLYWSKSANLEILGDDLFFLFGYILILLLYLVPAGISYLLIHLLIVKKIDKGEQSTKSTFLALGVFFGGLVFIYAAVWGDPFGSDDISVSGGQAGIEMLFIPFIIIFYQIIGSVVGAITGFLWAKISGDKDPDFKTLLTFMFVLFLVALVITLLFI